MREINEESQVISLILHATAQPTNPQKPKEFDMCKQYEKNTRTEQEKRTCDTDRKITAGNLNLGMKSLTSYEHSLYNLLQGFCGVRYTGACWQLGKQQATGMWHQAAQCGVPLMTCHTPSASAAATSADATPPPGTGRYYSATPPPTRSS